MTSEAEVRRLLNEILDPCSVTAGVPAGLDDMGLVREIRVAGEEGAQCVSLRVGVTEPGCFMMGPFANEARIRLLALDDVSEVELELDNGFDWDESKLAPAYRVRLEEHRSRTHGRSRLPLFVAEPG